MSKKIVPDTSIIIDGILSEMVSEGKLKNIEVVIPEMVLDELQSQANRGLEIGWDGLKEIKKLRELPGVKVNTTGRRPTAEEIGLAKKGRIDALIRDVAKEEAGILYTADMVQAEVAQADGLEVVYVKPEQEDGLTFEKYLTDDTMSIHLKEGAVPRAKRGKPGKIMLKKISEKPLSREDMNALADNIVQVTRKREDGHFEITRTGAEVIQLGKYRIAITKPPFSKNMEITVVRPIVKLTLEDYKPTDKLMNRLAEQAEGILVAGPPGSGKSTFVQSLAEFYLGQDMIVKTMESPRDLDLPPEVTQYAPLAGSMENTADILLLVRPDYTIYDELRKTADFRIFADMRLAGVGMVGVTHATKPIDALQRFLGRTELGIIPHVIDTIIYIKSGKIEKIYDVGLLVKVPTGMFEQDLARPVVEVRDFENGKLEYEIYSYGEENVVIPISEEKSSGFEKLALDQIRDHVRKYDKNAQVEFAGKNRVQVRLKNDVIARFIGKSGSNISKIEKELGVGIDVQPAVENMGKEVRFEAGESGANIILSFDKSLVGKNANIYIGNEYLFTATVGKSAQIRIGKSSDIGKHLMSALTSKRSVSVFI